MWAAYHCLHVSTLLLSNRRHQVTGKPGTVCCTLCLPPPPISERRFTQPTGIAIYFIAAIIKKHGTLLLLVCCYLKLFPICIASFMKLQRNTVKILQRLSITLSPTTSDSILNSYDPLRDKRCRQKNCREQFVPKTFTLIKLSSK